MVPAALGCDYGVAAIGGTQLLEVVVDLGVGDVLDQEPGVANEQQFTLTPWRPILERFRGREIVGIARGLGISWQLGLQRGRGFRPGGTCRTIVTSRNGGWGREWRQMTVRKLDPDSAARLLLHGTGRKDYEGARALANELDGLALPLTHAAAFLRENKATSFADFIRRFDELMEWQTEDADVRTTFATYSMAISQVFNPRPAAETVMCVAAYCAPESIPTSFFESAVSAPNGPVEVPASSRQHAADRVKDALGALALYGLVDVESESSEQQRISIHRVLQRVIRKSHIDKKETERWGCSALRALETNAASHLEEVTRHAQEALTVVPDDVCRGTRAALRTIVSEQSRTRDGKPQVDISASRPQEVERIHRLFAERSQRRIALVGPAGFGKTTIARFYVDRYRRDYDDIWWIDASSAETLMRSLADSANRASGVAITSVSEGLDVASRTARQRPVLLVCDNAEAPNVMGGLRLHGNVRLLVISRDMLWRPDTTDTTVISVGALPLEEAVNVLAQGSGLTDRDELRDLAEILEGHPLALSQAAATLRASGISVAEYAARIKEERLSVVPEGSIGATLQRWLNQLKQEDPATDAVLTLLAFCAADEIPIDLIAEACKRPPASGHGLPGDVERALQHLVSQGTIRLGSDDVGAFVSARPLVLEAKFKSLSSDDKRAWGEAVRAGAVLAFPDLRDTANWAKAERIAHQGLAIEERAPPENTLWRARLLTAIGSLRLQQGEYEAAETLLQQAVEVGDGDAESGGGELAFSLNEYSVVLQHLGKHETAEAAARRALLVAERSLGPDHPAVADCLNNLAQLLRASGRFDEIERLMTRALAISERNLGPESLTLARSMGNLAHLLQDTHRPTEAEPLYRRALAIAERSLGPDHPEVAISLGNVAQTLIAANRLAEAEPLLMRALAINERALGPDHPDVAVNLRALAQLYGATNRLEDAEAVYRRAWAITEQSRGPDHEESAFLLIGLADVLRATNRPNEAEPLYRRALAITEKRFGSDHSRTEHLRNLIASLARPVAAAKPRRRGRWWWAVLFLLSIVVCIAWLLLR